MRLPSSLFVAVLAVCSSASLAAPAPSTDATGIDFRPPVVRPPTGLSGDPGQRSHHIEWNPNLEENLAGYHVYRAAGQGRALSRITAAPVRSTEYLDASAPAGKVRYAVTAVMRSGVESGKSTELELEPRQVQAPRIAEGRAVVTVPGHATAEVAKALDITFDNEHRIVFDTELARLRDWVTPKGIHLVYPEPYGNPIDLTALDEFGFQQPQPATFERPVLPPPINLDYRLRNRQLAAWWVGHKIEGNRVTLEYRIPLSGPGIPQGTSHDVWIWATIWETYTPVVRKVGGAEYSGLARRIEVDVPSYYKDGYSVCLNDGFGVNGSSDGALTYELRWSGPDETYVRTTRWRKGQNGQGEGTPRSTRGFHPTESATQVSPFLLATFPQGALLLAPRRYYYSTNYALRNYAAQGQDGLWPNYAIDVAHSGSRHAVETFEYLWTDDVSLAPPQKWIDASFYYRRNLARLYALNPNLPAMDYAWDYWGPGPKALGGKSLAESLATLRQWGSEFAQRGKRAGADMLGGAHELWTSSPYTVPDDIRLNLAHPVNRAIADTVAEFKREGIRFGYWIRPEFVKQSMPNALSTHFHTKYYGYVGQLIPRVIDAIAEDGLPLVRKHPEWLRTGRGGVYPMKTPYNWTPTSLTSGSWYDEVVYKSLIMMKRLGMTSALQDGGFSNLAGVDYTGGKARAVQPHYWRLYQDMARLGIDLDGECMTGWAGNNLGTPKPDDMKSLWALPLTTYRGNRDGRAVEWHTAEMRHRSHQVYAAAYLHIDGGPGHAAAARFAQEFVRKHGHPDRVVLDKLRWDEGKQEWLYDGVFWEYKDGRRVRYPNYGEVSTGALSFQAGAPAANLKSKPKRPR